MEQGKQAQPKKKKGALLTTLLALLLVCELVTTAVLSSRLQPSVSFQSLENARIPLAGFDRTADAQAGAADADGTTFTVSDDETVWETETQVNIFHLRYDNGGDGIYTVDSATGDKLVAPGTGNAYIFRLTNPSEEIVDYTLSFQEWVEGGEEFPLPIRYRLVDDEGHYYLGSAEEWAEPAGLNGVTAAETLDPRMNRAFTLEWMWPFETADEDGSIAAGDDYDTMLGNLAVGQDIVEHISIRTVAESQGPLEPDDGRAWALLNLIAMILTDIVAIVEVIRWAVGRKEEQEPDEAAAQKAAPVAAAAAEAEPEPEKKRKRNGWKLTELAPLIFGTVVFFLTEDMRLPMVWKDRWTLLMIVILLVSVTLALLTRRRKDKEEEEDQAAPTSHQ